MANNTNIIDDPELGLIDINDNEAVDEAVKALEDDEPSK